MYFAAAANFCQAPDAVLVQASTLASRKAVSVGALAPVATGSSSGRASSGAVRGRIALIV